uniref:Guanine nucleotide-binding protein subunit gamma n=1 Tax=Papio anubis TaxID=9555 RepID=A0A8I5NRV5_PAPAN
MTPLTSVASCVVIPGSCLLQCWRQCLLGIFSWSMTSCFSFVWRYIQKDWEGCNFLLSYKVSKCCEEVRDYVEERSGEDPLVKGIPEDKNPFKELKGGCVIS